MQILFLHLQGIIYLAQTPTITSGSNLGVFSIGELQIALTATGGSGPLDGERHIVLRAALRTDLPSFFPAGTTAESSALLPRPALIIFP